MTTEYMIGDMTRGEWLNLLNIASADDPKLAALAALSWGGNALKVLQVNATENGWQFATMSAPTGAALTKTDDTNVTLTLGGSPTTALLNAASVTVGWTGTLAVARGGTGGGSASGTLLDNISGFASTGMIARTGAGTYAFRTLTAPAAGITVSNGSGVAGNPTLALANDLSALEALSGTNTIYYRSGVDTWSAVTIGSAISFSAGTLDRAALTGDITASAGSNATTLATVNSNVGSFGSATQVATFTVNAKGLTTAAANVTITPAVGSITGLGTGVATFLATASSANLAAAITDETGSGALVFGTTPTLATPVINGLPTGTGVSAGSVASVLAARDANKNLLANNFLADYTTTATAAGTTTLTVASTYLQFFTGTTTQTVTLPVASTLALGQQFQIVNNSTGAVTVNSSGGNAVVVLAGGTAATVTCILTSGTTAASWSVSYWGDVVASGKKLTVSNTLTIAATDGVTLTVGASGATVSGTNTGDQTSVSGNAGTATTLQTSRNIDGQAFNGSANITVIAPGTHAASSKTTPVDADELPLVDSAASNVLAKLTWANLKATLKTYFDTLYAPILPKSARVYNSAAISIANATETALTFNSERWDNDTIHSTVTNTSRLTATTAGLYAIGGTVSFAASGAGTYRVVTIRLGGATWIGFQGMPPVGGGSGATTVSLQTQYSLAAGDYVELTVIQDTGGALNINAGGNYSPEFFMTRIGPQP